jgi:O-antigen ligase
MRSWDRAAGRVDALGWALVAGFAAVVVGSAGRIAPVLGILVAATAGLVLGRATADHLSRWVVPLCVCVTAASLVLVSPGVVGGGPLSGPFGYRNATGAFFAQAAIAGAMVAVATRRVPLIAFGIVSALGFGIVAVQASDAAAVSLGVAFVAGPAVARPGWARPAVLVSAAAFVAILATTVVLGATYREGERGGVEGDLRSALTERRVALWHDALVILADHPGGVGSGRFADASPTARSDPDARRAHNEFLQQGAELGWAGLVLTVLLFLWGFARLWVRPAPDAVVALGAAALAALAIHASVDHILHVPAVAIAAAALLGTAQAVPRRRVPDDRHEHGEEGVEGRGHPARVVGTPAPR